MEGLLFGLKLGTLIPLIPPFYCQLFPSYRRICTEFRICATVHHSNLYPTDAALSFISSINTPPQSPPPHPTTIPSSRCPQQYSFLFLFPPYLRHLAALGSDGAVARRQVKLESICAQRTIGAWRFTAEKKLILILSIHTGRHGCAPLSLVVPKKNSVQTLAWSFEKAPFSHNETICARVCRCKRWRRTLCSRISVHARLFCCCACLCIC